MQSFISPLKIEDEVIHLSRNVSERIIRVENHDFRFFLFYDCSDGSKNGAFKFVISSAFSSLWSCFDEY